MIPVFIIMRDMLTWPQGMLKHLDTIDGVYPVLIDNASTYPPLLEFYEQYDGKVIRLSENLGHHSPWISQAVDTIAEDMYIVTDPDLDISGVPKDCVEVLKEGFYKFPDVTKVGLSLRIDDIPDAFPKKAQVLQWETPFWENCTDGKWYHSPIDTTFALYSKHRHVTEFIRAVRVAEPYTARHLPFYLTEYDAEYDYYMKHASSVSTIAGILKGYWT